MLCLLLILDHCEIILEHMSPVWTCQSSISVINAAITTTRNCPCHQNFFGPVHNWREGFLEEAFQLQMHLNMSYTEVRRLPTRYRRWYLDRLVRYFKDRNAPSDKESTISNDNIDSLKQYEAMLNKKFE